MYTQLVLSLLYGVIDYFRENVTIRLVLQNLILQIASLVIR